MSSTIVQQQTGKAGMWIILLALILGVVAVVHRNQQRKEALAEQRHAVEAKRAAEAAREIRQIEEQRLAEQKEKNFELQKQAALQAQSQQLALQESANLENEKKQQDLSMIQMAEQAIKVGLKDPLSAQFQNMAVYHNYSLAKLDKTKSGSTTLVCGEFNAKNAMGGYIGFQNFYWESATQKLFYTDVVDFREMFNRIAKTHCDEAAGIRR